MSRVPVLSIAACLIGAALVPAACAEPMRPPQDPTPQHQYPALNDYVSDPLEVQAAHNFGACIVGYTPEGARQVLSLDYRSEAYSRKLHELAKGHVDRCALGGWRYR